MNPFKYGNIVQDEFFTDRAIELERVKQAMDSENHLVLISPRRFGKSSLIRKALSQLNRPSITISIYISSRGFLINLIAQQRKEKLIWTQR